MFSTRAGFDLTENALARAVAARRGARLLDLTQSNPTAAGLSYDATAILSALADPAALMYEPTPRGLLAARAAVAGYYGDAGTAERTLLTASTSEAYSFLFKLLCDPGDSVCVPRPSYPLFDYLAALESVRVRPYDLAYDGAWHIDLPQLEAAARGARAIVLVNPNNPTGSFLHAEELARLCALGLPLISDEVFKDFAFGDDASRVTTLALQEQTLAFSLSGLSKVCGLPQLKLGWVVVSGPAPERALALARLELIADTFLSVGTPVQHAAARLLVLRGPLAAQIRARVTRNRAALCGALGTHSPASLLDCEGGWYATLRLPRTRSEETWTLELLARDVLVHPGYFFDFANEAHVIVSLLTEEDTFAEGIGRLLDHVRDTA
jgi:aspartate/methionine/tyrosine aminotransferase